MLPDDDPRVIAALNKLKSRQMTEGEIKESLTSGSSWPTGHKQHQDARQQLSARFQAQAGATLPVRLHCSSSI
jgi:hypothetical protein